MAQKKLMKSRRFNNMKSNRIFCLILCLSFLMGIEFSFMHTVSAAKTGAPCNKLGSKSLDGNKPLVCNKNNSGKLVWSSPKLKSVSREVFRKSLSVMKVSLDEFEGNYEIYPKGDLNQYVIQGKTAFRLSSNITKRDKNSAWVFSLVPDYSGEDWLNLDEINIKSDFSILNYDDVIIINSNVLDGGRVYEIGRKILTNQQAEKFCTLINEQNIKFRLSGVGGKTLQVTGNMPTTLKNSLNASCQVFVGLLQGFKP